MTTVSKRLVVRGRVQGVFYRQSCVEQARASGVNGWVRNSRSGDVEVRVEGPPVAVARLVDWCHRGPPHAVVTEVEVHDAPLEKLRGFRAR